MYINHQCKFIGYICNAQVSESIHCNAKTQEEHLKQLKSSLNGLSDEANLYGQSSSLAVGNTTRTLDSLVYEVRRE